MRFYGEYRHTVDAKGRVSLPAKFRKALPEDVVIVPGSKQALYVFSDENFEAWVDSFFVKNEDGSGGFNPRSRNDINLRRNLNASAESVTVDSAGRVTISAAKRKASGIEKDVVILGNEDHLEIWDAETYEEDKASFNLDDFLV